MMTKKCYLVGINHCLCLPKAELKTKNSTKRQLFGFQLDSLEINLVTLPALTFTVPLLSGDPAAHYTSFDGM